VISGELERDLLEAGICEGREGRRRDVLVRDPGTRDVGVADEGQPVGREPGEPYGRLGEVLHEGGGPQDRPCAKAGVAHDALGLALAAPVMG
jgi:hypothetical protein